LIQASSLSLYRTYRAPSANGEALIEPVLSSASQSVSRNQANANSWRVSFADRPIAEVQKDAREQLRQDAYAYSRKYRCVAEPDARHAIVMAGHQPTLFHPGVWFKNFALAEVARLGNPSSQPGGMTAINLVIDNDVASSSAVRVPVIDVASGLVRQESIPFDSAAGGVPYEQNRIRERATFESFGTRLRDAISPLVPEPLVTPLWKHAQGAVARCENVSCALAHARHSLEGEVGLQTLELPLSVVCRTESFASFVIEIVRSAARFREVYNQSIVDYRLHHGIRSNAHPVPELSVRDEWTEMPFWLYGDDSPQRRALWGRSDGAFIELSDRKQKHLRLSTSAGANVAAEALAAHAGPNWKLRPRALMTTMYARMVLSDLFIHGIGGAKYDQLGDQIMHRFFGIQAPEMMVVSATVQLPAEDLISQGESVDSIRQKLRDTQFAPETFEDQLELPRSLLERKRELLASIPGFGQRLSWHQELHRVNQLLSGELAEVRARLDAQLQLAKQQATSRAILKSREYSFCLYNLDDLRQRFASMLGS
jgi:hypothetical protein